MHRHTIENIGVGEELVFTTALELQPWDPPFLGAWSNLPRSSVQADAPGSRGLAHRTVSWSWLSDGVIRSSVRPVGRRRPPRDGCLVAECLRFPSRTRAALLGGEERTRRRIAHTGPWTSPRIEPDRLRLEQRRYRPSTTRGAVLGFHRGAPARPAGNPAMPVS